MRPIVERIRDAMEAVRPSPEERMKAERVLLQGGGKIDWLPRLQREWSMDCLLLDGPSVPRPVHSNMPSFSTWMEERVLTPYAVSRTKLATAGHLYGEDVAMGAMIVAWPSEVALAEVWRRLAGDVECCLAHAWLRSSAKDPGNAFLDFVEAMCHEPRVGALRGHGFPRDLEAMTTLPDVGRPIFLRIAEVEFLKTLINRPPAQIAVMAERIRAIAAEEIQADSNRDEARKVAALCPHYRISVLAQAADVGAVSDEVLAALDYVLERVRAGERHGVPWHVVLSNRVPRHLGSAVNITDDEALQRRSVVSRLGHEWLGALPEDWTGWHDGRACGPVMAGQWVSEVTEGKRRPPLDPVLDYGVWLAERR